MRHEEFYNEYPISVTWLNDGIGKLLEKYTNIIIEANKKLSTGRARGIAAMIIARQYGAEREKMFNYYPHTFPDPLADFIDAHTFHNDETLGLRNELVDLSGTRWEEEDCIIDTYQRLINKSTRASGN